MRGWRAVDAEIGFLGANQIAVTLRSPAMRLHRIESLSRHFSDKIARKIKVS